MSLFKFVHTNRTTQAKIPGKLYIAGEYAVIEPNYPAILVTVDQYLKATLKPLGDEETIRLHSESLDPAIFVYQPDTVVPAAWRYVCASIKLFEQLLAEHKIPLKPFSLSFESELEAENGVKYGFGSSGAVVLATLHALANYYEMRPFNSIILYKMAVMVMLSLDSPGSFGDLAAESIGGWVYYRSCDREWIRQQLEVFPMSTVIAMDWPELEITPLEAPTDLNLAIGWTGQPASTDDFVERLSHQISHNPSPYQQFLRASQVCLAKMRQAFDQGETSEIMKEIEIYRRLLTYLDTIYQLGMMTEEMQTLIDKSDLVGYAAKSSGAGGGDCGIAISSSPKNRPLLVKLWRDHEIELLPYQVARPLNIR